MKVGLLLQRGTPFFVMTAGNVGLNVTH